MPSILKLARQYLAHRRKLGFALSIQGQHIIAFARFASRIAPGQPLATAVALHWATHPKSQYRGYVQVKHDSLPVSAAGAASNPASAEKATEGPAKP